MEAEQPRKPYTLWRKGQKSPNPRGRAYIPRSIIVTHTGGDVAVYPATALAQLSSGELGQLTHLIGKLTSLNGSEKPVSKRTRKNGEGAA